MTVIHRLAAAGLLVFGLVHLGFTVVAYEGWSAEAAFFAGTGLCLVIAALFNFAVSSRSPVRAVVLCFVADLAGTGFAVAVARVVPVPQSMAVVALFGASTLAVIGFLLRGPRPS